jgi:hypothetical protein
MADSDAASHQHAAAAALDAFLRAGGGGPQSLADLRRELSLSGPSLLGEIRGTGGGGGGGGVGVAGDSQSDMVGTAPAVLLCLPLYQ